jgi:hypothetical protein
MWDGQLCALCNTLVNPHWCFMMEAPIDNVFAEDAISAQLAAIQG